MVNCAMLFELELNSIDGMSRPQLLQALHERWESLPMDLRVCLENEPTDHLRLLLVAGRLLHALRQILGRSRRLDLFGGTDR
jgi:hypothetical protein